MKIAIGSDEKTHTTDAVVEELKKRGLEVELHGPLTGQRVQWADVAVEVGKSVAEGKSDQGVLFCWTGTGVSMDCAK